jgi:regulatory protein
MGFCKPKLSSRVSEISLGWLVNNQACIMTDRTITAIIVQKRNPNRVNVELDGEFAFGLDRMVAAWLKVGQQLSQERIDHLCFADSIEKAFIRAVRLLSYRPRSEAEIRERLRKSGQEEIVIDQVIHKMRESQLLDDEGFSKEWIENRSTFRPRSRRLLQMELKQKGIPQDIIKKTLEETQDDTTLALQAATKSAHRWTGLDESEFRKKLTGFLGRRGFSYSIISEIIPLIWSAEKAKDETPGIVH